VKLSRPLELVTEVNAATVVRYKVTEAVSVDWSAVLTTFVVVSATDDVPSFAVVVSSGNYAHDDSYVVYTNTMLDVPVPYYVLLFFNYVF